ncbi:cap-specific mRNA (nucleoside-2'-O-)-methyltransferase 1-like [Mytilus trossulus]|uniref:cap-specific mRNA (nucleoside-2'-O-)-methyltransferase 1-like n=1 Tax=Mytilus trossulus TaxID=6551 RepID=UPI003006DF4B
MNLEDSDSDSDSDNEKLQVYDGGNGDDIGAGEPAVKKAKTSSQLDGYTDFAKRMMAKMGHKKGSGLGKRGQGIVDIIEASKQRGRRGLGLTLKGLEPADIDWDFEQEKIVQAETVEWIPSCTEETPSIETLRSWKKIGNKKRTIGDETQFCDEKILQMVLSSKSIFDNLEPEEMRRARTRSNPYETIRGAFFLNRAAMKMANMDAILDFMFTKPLDVDGKPLMNPSELLYFSDICAGPGGFSEYVLWRSKAEAKGFGMTLRGPCDFKLEDFFAGPAEMFEPYYGVGGAEGDGDIFNPDNQAAFIQFVKENTDGKGVHFVMADGGFSVEGQENIQEILSKQLYLCQFLVAISILRTGGHFVCKLFDLFTPFSIGLCYLMYRIFNKISIIKPVTSRPANSERYIVCKNLSSDMDTVRQYFHEINLELNKLLVSTSSQDINEIVPYDILEESEHFFTYMFNSNNTLGKMQIAGLKKIQAFTQNTELYEARQSETRTECLVKWQVPDEVRTAPSKQPPGNAFLDLVETENTDYITNDIDKLSPTDLHNIKSPFDYRCYVIGNVERKRLYMLGCGRSHVYKWDGRGKWKKLDEDNIHVELPAKTLIEVEFVQELKGEGMGQKRLMTVHVLDALFLYGNDVRKLHFTDRMEKLKKFVKSVTKKTRPNLTPIIAPNVYRLEQIGQIFERLEFKRVKGSGQPRLCYFPPDRPDERCFLPTGVCIIKTVKEPWTIALSKSANRKYFYNTSSRSSTFEAPPDSVASARECKLNSYRWDFEMGVKIHPNQTFEPDNTKISLTDMLSHIQKIMPH